MLTKCSFTKKKPCDIAYNSKAVGQEKKALLFLFCPEASGVRTDEELLRLFVAKIVVEATDHFIWYLNFSGRDITDALDVVAGKKNKSSVTLSAKSVGKKLHIYIF